VNDGNPTPNPSPSALDLRPGLPRAFAGIWSLTWRAQLTRKRLWGALIFLLPIPAVIFATTDQGNTDQFLDWTVRFYLFLVLPLNCLFGFGSLIRDEIQADTLPFLITRPVKRWQLYLLKFLCMLICLQVLLAINGVIFTGIAVAKGLSELGTLLPLFLLSQALAGLAYGALAGFLGLLSRKFIVLGVVYGFVVEVGIGNLPTNAHSLSVAYHLRTILANHPAIERVFSLTADAIIPATGFVIGVFAVAAIAASVLFNVREYHHGGEMQK
jgi:ABC-2 type transport system permease protein